jgi:hypothetical protein
MDRDELDLATLVWTPHADVDALLAHTKALEERILERGGSRAINTEQITIHSEECTRVTMDSISRIQAIKAGRPDPGWRVEPVRALSVGPTLFRNFLNWVKQMDADVAGA